MYNTSFNSVNIAISVTCHHIFSSEPTVDCVLETSTFLCYKKLRHVYTTA